MTFRTFCVKSSFFVQLLWTTIMAITISKTQQWEKIVSIHSIDRLSTSVDLHQSPPELHLQQQPHNPLFPYRWSTDFFGLAFSPLFWSKNLIDLMSGIPLLFLTHSPIQEWWFRAYYFTTITQIHQWLISWFLVSILYKGYNYLEIEIF